VAVFFQVARQRGVRPASLEEATLPQADCQQDQQQQSSGDGHDDHPKRNPFAGALLQQLRIRYRLHLTSENFTLILGSKSGMGRKYLPGICHHPYFGECPADECAPLSRF